MSSSVFVGNMSYDEILMPTYMVPVSINGEVVWKEQSLNKRAATSSLVVESLRNRFDRLFSLLKMYIDDFNLTYLCYNETRTLFKESTEEYDSEYGLNGDLKSKLIEWTNELEKVLSRIHPLYLELKELLTVKVVY